MENSQVTANEEEVSSKILTVPNVISFIRMLLVPAFFILLTNGQRIPALVVYAVSASTDFLDGQIARRCHCVSRLGQLLDPSVDTLLMVSGVVGTWLYCGLPTWVLIVVFAREVFVLSGGFWLLHVKHIRIPVVYPGKVATALLFFGMCLLFLNETGLWFVYFGVILQLAVTVYYVYKGVLALKTCD